MKHKHNWCIVFAETQPEVLDMGKDKVVFDAKVGCQIYCSVCGKQKRRLSKKIGKYYANTKIPALERLVKDFCIYNVPRTKKGEEK